MDGAIIREASLPSWMQWDQRYDWDWSQCTGTRVFQGLHALSIFTNDNGGYTLLTANQAAPRKAACETLTQPPG